jgi:hypothetical protein
MLLPEYFLSPVVFALSLQCLFKCKFESVTVNLLRKVLAHQYSRIVIALIPEILALIQPSAICSGFRPLTSIPSQEDVFASRSKSPNLTPSAPILVVTTGVEANHELQILPLTPAPNLNGASITLYLPKVSYK